MKVEPRIDHPSLAARVAELYSLPVTWLTFVPEGEVSVAYVVNCAGGSRSVLKLWADSRQGRMQRAKLAVSLPIIRELYERDLFRELPAPIPTTAGALHARYEGYGLALFAYVDGQPLTHPAGVWPAGVAGELARAFARLHRATDLLRSPLPRESAFETSFAADLRRGLAALAVIGPRDRPGLIRLRAMLLPRRAALLDRLAETEQLAEIAGQRAARLVLCHTDIGGNNVLIDAAGKVYVLDWDDLILAPPEHDLQEYRHAHFARFLELYVRAGGVAALDPLQFVFYLQRRYLADLTDWLMRILEENSDPLQDDFDLAGIETYSLAGLDNFPAEIDGITRAIASVPEIHG